jgi:hypothetical protein
MRFFLFVGSNKKRNAANKEMMFSPYRILKDLLTWCRRGRRCGLLAFFLWNLGFLRRNTADSRGWSRLSRLAVGSIMAKLLPNSVVLFAFLTIGVKSNDVDDSLGVGGLILLRDS